MQMRAQFKQFVCYHDGASFCSNMILGFRPRGCFPHCQIVGVGSLVCLWLQNWAACFVVANGVGSGICVPKAQHIKQLAERTSSICRLVWLNRLSIRERLSHWQVSSVIDLCEFCQQVPQTRNHIFFSCAVTGEI